MPWPEIMLQMWVQMKRTRIYSPWLRMCTFCYSPIRRADRSARAPRSQSQFFYIRYSRFFDIDTKFQIFLWYSSSIKDSLHKIKFLYEKNGRCEKYTAIKKFTASIFARKICICLSGTFTFAALAIMGPFVPHRLCRYPWLRLSNPTLHKISRL